MYAALRPWYVPHMRRTRWPAALLAFALVAFAVAIPVEASAKAKLYRFTIKSKMHMDWQWPPNQFNKGQRDSEAHDVLGGSGCGTKPTKARWKIREQTEGLPAQTLIVDFVFGGAKNPAKISDNNYAGTPSADVQIYLKFGSLKNLKVTLQAKPTGDVVGPNINPATSKLKKKAVKKCPIS